MARNSPSAGIYKSVSELNSTEEDFQDMTVRVTGRMLDHDYLKREACVVEVERRASDDRGPSLVVDTSLVEPLPACQLIQFIGEMDCPTEKRILRARVVREVDGLDLTLYAKAVNLRTEYLTSREKPG